MTRQATPALQRLRLTLHGAVQGVGFRPFVYRLARGMGLTGWVQNSNGGLIVEIEGGAVDLALFEQRLLDEKPAPAVVLKCESRTLAPAGFSAFTIRGSASEQSKSVGVQPDLALCADCLAEISDPANRRFQYPFTNCTLCGPRFSILLDLPYDRPNTTMRLFEMCPSCRGEYGDPGNRRFHAQPNACPACGPKLAGATLSDAAWALAAGAIVALKGIGGFQLLVDARDAAAVARLRQRKHREAKPLALMMLSLDMVRRYCEVSEAEETLLASPAAPIVLLRPRPMNGIAPNVAGPSACLGVMLPYSPLHHMLMAHYPFPLVATSGNRSEEPIATGNEEALRRLDGIADLFVLHNRPVARPCDDSVVRLARGRVSVIRRARGYAPLPIRVAEDLTPVLAVGGHLKSTVAIAFGRQVVMSQHIGDLDSPEAREQFERTIADFRRLYDFRPDRVACDLHPDYASSLWAARSGLPVVRVQHHQAHVAACAAENEVRGPYLGVAWDGAGLGIDGVIWGGEFFHAEGGEFMRIAHLRAFPLPGGEAAIREGWRAAAGLMWECGGRDRLAGPLAAPLVAPLVAMLRAGLNTPQTTSAGRLFDAVAALLELTSRNEFEGHAAMLLERAAEQGAAGAGSIKDAYPLVRGDWEPLLHGIQEDIRRGVPVGIIAARFHHALVHWIVEVAEESHLHQVVMSGGVFQNRYLTERAVEQLERRGHAVFTHRQTPANDGGLALGQAVIAGRR